ncbi:MAG: hypothetical protein JNK41_09060, partial [Saprospiraceae bacterium]|nr:hypothetical protein [Saprospiraceae bacterium]
ALKFFPHLSPSENLAQYTIYNIFLGLMPKHTGLILLAKMECGIGSLFISGKFIKTAIVVALIHMACTFTPLFFFSEISFAKPPLVFTLVGQYIMKNIVFICALWLLWPSEDKSSNKKKASTARKLEEMHV